MYGDSISEKSQTRLPGAVFSNHIEGHVFLVIQTSLP